MKKWSLLEDKLHNFKTLEEIKEYLTTLSKEELLKLYSIYDMRMGGFDLFKESKYGISNFKIYCTVDDMMLEKKLRPMKDYEDLETWKKMKF